MKSKELCPSGEISGFASPSCRDCELGSFAASPGMSTCEICLAGTYGHPGENQAVVGAQ